MSQKKGSRHKPDRSAKPTERIRSWIKQTLAWTRNHVPPGLRLLLGLLLVIGGIFGILPVLGFWMIPLGIAVAALDIRPMWRAFSQRFRGRSEDT